MVYMGVAFYNNPNCLFMKILQCHWLKESVCKRAIIKWGQKQLKLSFPLEIFLALKKTIERDPLPINNAVPRNVSLCD